MDKNKVFYYSHHFMVAFLTFDTEFTAIAPGFELAGIIELVVEKFVVLDCGRNLRLVAQTLVVQTFIEELVEVKFVFPQEFKVAALELERAVAQDI